MTSSTCQTMPERNRSYDYFFFFFFKQTNKQTTPKTVWCFSEIPVLKTLPDISLQVTIKDALLIILSNCLTNKSRRTGEKSSRTEDFYLEERLGNVCRVAHSGFQCTGNGLCHMPNLKTFVASRWLTDSALSIYKKNSIQTVNIYLLSIHMEVICTHLFNFRKQIK